MTYSISGRFLILPIKVGVISKVRKLREEDKSNLIDVGKPLEVSVKGLIDTGASISIMDQSIRERLRLDSNGYCDVSGFKFDEGETDRFPNHDVSLTLGPSGKIIFPHLQVCSCPLSRDGYDFLIGMDVLQHLDLTICGQPGEFTITAPGTD